MTNVTTTTTFQERMFERIKSQMGELMTDEELKALLEKSVHEAFFKPRIRVEGYGYNEKKVESDSHFTEMMREQLNANMSEHAKRMVEAWFIEHPETFREAVDTAIAKGFLQVVQEYVNKQLAVPLSNLSSSIFNLEQNLRNVR